MDNENVHKGHRKRLREKYIKLGLSSLAEHEILELLLFYAIPQGNTNEVAHGLISRFGSLANVFETDVQTLMQVNGIGEVAATLISLQSDMCRQYYESKKEIKNVQLTPKNAGDIIKGLFYGCVNEQFYMISLDGQNRVINKDMICEGTINGVPIYTRKIITRALNLSARKVIFAHNHPNGVLVPSEDDKNTTKMLISALSFIEVGVEDHIIVSHDNYCSMKWDFNVF